MQKSKNNGFFYVKMIIGGLFIATLHFALSFILALYFCLGMSEDGALFLHHIFMQPGTIIDVLLCKYFFGENRHFAAHINFIFYWFIFSFLFYFIGFIKKRKLGNVVGPR